MTHFRCLAGGFNKSKTGAIVGAIIGSVSLVAFIVLFLLWRRNRCIRETFYDVSGNFVKFLVCSCKVKYYNWQVKILSFNFF